MNGAELKFLAIFVTAALASAGVVLTQPAGVTLTLNPIKAFAIVAHAPSNFMIAGTWKASHAIWLIMGTNNTFDGYGVHVWRTGYVGLPPFLLFNIRNPGLLTHPSNGSFAFRFTVYGNGTVGMWASVHTNSTVGYSQQVFMVYLHHFRNIVIGLATLSKNDFVALQVYEAAMPGSGV